MKISSIVASPPRLARRPFSPSPQQAVFLDALTEGDSHILLEARAGSGKSTTCREGAHSLEGRRSIYCCFNKHIQLEFQPGLPPNCEAATLHSLGMRLLRGALGSIEVDAKKMRNLAKEIFPRPSERFVCWSAAKLAGLCKNLLIDGRDRDEVFRVAVEFGVDLAMTPPPDEDASHPLFDDGDDRGPLVVRPWYADAIDAVPDLLGMSLERTDVIDFDDMVWAPVVMGLRASRSPDVLFVDEAQDLNAAQHALVSLLCPDGRMVVVGDVFQSIYAFRGADTESIANLSERLSDSPRGLRSLPLNVTFRCPQSVVAMANRLVPDLNAKPDAPEGVIDLADDWRGAVGGDSLVLCRTNAPLIEACFAAWAAGVPARIVGRDIGKGLISLLDSLRRSTVKDTIKAVQAHRDREMAKLESIEDSESTKATVNDRCDCLLAVLSGADSIGEARDRVNRMFVETPDDRALTFSSIHRSKGLERDHVVILRPDLIPGPWAGNQEAVQQERNIAYVAVTRAKKRLTFCGDVPAILR